MEIGPLQFHAYGLMIGIAMLVGVHLGEGALAWQGFATDRYWRVVGPSLLMGLVGARLYHVASEPLRYWRSPLQIVEIWNGGLGIYGAILFGAATALYLAPRHGIPRGVLLDAGAVGVPIAQAIGRWGNWFNQELFGGPLSAPWALRVDPHRRPAEFAAQETFHPTFLYESLWTLALAAAAALLLRHWHSRPPGAVFIVYLAGYSMGRFAIESLRVDPAHEWLGLRQNQYVAAAVVVVCLVALVWLVARHSADRRQKTS